MKFGLDNLAVTFARSVDEAFAGLDDPTPTACRSLAARLELAEAIDPWTSQGMLEAVAIGQAIGRRNPPYSIVDDIVGRAVLVSLADDRATDEAGRVVAVGYTDGDGRSFARTDPEPAVFALVQPDHTWVVATPAEVEIRERGHFSRARPLVELALRGPGQAVDDGGYLSAVDLVLTSAELLGLASELFTRTVAYVKQRRQFGVPIGSFQALQHRLADEFVELRALESQLLYTAYAVGTRGAVDMSDPDYGAAHDHCATWAAAVSATAGEVGMLAARNAFQLHGGIAITEQLWVHDWARSALELALHRGSSEEKFVYVGERVADGVSLFVDLVDSDD